ncbi:MAG: RsmG family class I SAM-dependent methyltransferase, partial [Oscillospiraceae bacterium]
NEVACELSLEVQTIHARAEDCDSVQLRESFDIATARAVAALPALCEYCLPYVKKGGVFVAMKGPSAGLEIQNANSAIKLLGGENAALYTENLPDGDERCFVFIKKVSQTSTKYPRKGIKIAKLPL